MLGPLRGRASRRFCMGDEPKSGLPETLATACYPGMCRLARPAIVQAHTGNETFFRQRSFGVIRADVAKLLRYGSDGRKNGTKDKKFRK